MSNHNALLRRLRENGNQTSVTGRDIVRELEYADNGTVQFYSGYETLDVSPSDVLSAAVFDYKQLAGNVTISGLEQVKNSGTEAIINLLEARINVLEKSLMNSLSTSLYSDGTGTSQWQRASWAGLFRKTSVSWPDAGTGFRRREPHRGYVGCIVISSFGLATKVNTTRWN